MKSDSKTSMHSPAVKELAKILFEKMEHLDPGSCGGGNWEELPELDKEFYAWSIEALVGNRILIESAVANDNMISRHSELCEKMNED